MNKLLALLRSPYPGLLQPWKSVVFPTIVIFLLIYLLRPFGISSLRVDALWISLNAAAITLLTCAVFTYLLPYLFPRYYDETRWTLGKFFLHMLELFLMITVLVWLSRYWLFDCNPDIRYLGYSLLWVLGLAPIPTALFMLWHHNLLLKRNLSEALEINNALSPSLYAENNESEEKKEEVILAFQDGQHTLYNIQASAFLYAESDGNYIKLFYTSAEGKLCEEYVRMTMKMAEEAITPIPYIIRCHRAFIVNLHRVQKVGGNSQGYRLQLEGCKEEVLVSRAYAKQVKELLSN